MLRKQRKEDIEQIIYIKTFLEEYINKLKNKLSLKYYYYQYNRISKALIIKDKLDTYS